MVACGEVEGRRIDDRRIGRARGAERTRAVPGEEREKRGYGAKV